MSVSLAPIKTPILTTKVQQRAAAENVALGSELVAYSPNSITSPSHTTPRLLKQLELAKHHKSRLRAASDLHPGVELYQAVNENNNNNKLTTIRFGKSSIHLIPSRINNTKKNRKTRRKAKKSKGQRRRSKRRHVVKKYGGGYTRKQKGGSWKGWAIVEQWEENGWLVTGSGNDRYLHCGTVKNNNTHIHFFPNQDTYLYKINGEHYDAEGNGYSIWDNGHYCLERGANAEWNVNQWCDFLHENLCGEEGEADFEFVDSGCA